jgi:aryl-alcohol dehydrogenase-like predicted oxidoreductase
MMDNKAAVKRSVIQLQRDFGNVLPIEEIVRANPEVEEEDIMKALDELKEDGLVTILDEDSIQVNI